MYIYIYCLDLVKEVLARLFNSNDLDKNDIKLLDELTSVFGNDDKYKLQISSCES